MHTPARLFTLVASPLIAALSLAPAQAEGALSQTVRQPHGAPQRYWDLPIWGWADLGEQVTVQLGDTAPVATPASPDGTWLLCLPPCPASGPFTLTVTGRNQIVLDDVLVGEVWLCSGQSNMEGPAAASNNADAEITAANYPQIRQYCVPHSPAGIPSDDVAGTSTVCSPLTAGSFSAVGYFFARHLHQELKVPVGLLHSSWGGSATESWIPAGGFAQVRALADIHARVTLADPRSDSYKQALADYLAQLEGWLAKARQALATH